MSYTKPQLRERIKARIMAGDKGGRPGQWSARKAQLLAAEYEKAGGGYSGKRNEKQKSLVQWTKEEWGTKSGKPSTQGPKATGERYLPKAARERLTDAEYAATSAKKRRDTAAGKQHSPQPKKIAEKTAMPMGKDVGKNIAELQADNKKKGKAKGYKGKARPMKQIIAIALEAARGK